jgi:hypothetical protein
MNLLWLYYDGKNTMNQREVARKGALGGSELSTQEYQIDLCDPLPMIANQCVYREDLKP